MTSRSWLLVLLVSVLALTTTASVAGTEEQEEEESACSATMSVSKVEVDLVLNDITEVTYYVHGSVCETITANITLSPGDSVVLEPIAGSSFILLPDNDTDQSFNVTLVTNHEGKVTMELISDSDDVDVSDAFVLVSVMKDPAYDTAAMTLGWISTIAWDISFLPQIWHNYRRNTVAGLSFDFLTFNFLGFSCYLMFNAGLLWIPAIKDQFEDRHPNELLHVRLNDVIFPLYAVICTAVQIAQCIFYPRSEGQRVSIPCRIITVILIVIIIISCILVPTVDNVLWLDILYLMSYVKLFISMIKYCPQLYTNYLAKSTAGWSIGQVFLDFTGGLLSLIQMILLAANYDDFNSMLTDPTKLGLGLLSIFFNIFFLLQHYCLYRGNEDPLLKGSDDVEKHSEADGDRRSSLKSERQSETF